MTYAFGRAFLNVDLLIQKTPVPRLDSTVCLSNKSSVTDCGRPTVPGEAAGQHVVSGEMDWHQLDLNPRIIAGVRRGERAAVPDSFPKCHS